MKSNISLGRGLSALLDMDGVSEQITEMGSVRSLNVQDLCPGKYQPRQAFNEELLDDLAQSIQKQGVLQPLIVRPLKNHVTPYEIVAGERRWQAAKKAGLLEVEITENVQRSDLNPIEEAEGYQRLMEDFSYTQEEVSISVGKSRSHIANTVRLLALSEEVKEYLQTGQLTAGHARALVGLENGAEIAKKIVEKKLSVRDVERLTSLQKHPKTNAPKGAAPEDITYLERVLSKALGTPVEIQLQENAGHLRISFSSLSKLDGLIRRLTGTDDNHT
jgi:ParB family chromosome partitioning protein